MEDKYNCAGICAQPLFFYTKDISAGRPQKECAQTVAEQYQNNMAIAAVAFITAALLIVAAIGAIPLCTNVSQAGQDDEEMPV